MFWWKGIKWHLSNWKTLHTRRRPSISGPSHVLNSEVSIVWKHILFVNIHKYAFIMLPFYGSRFQVMNFGGGENRQIGLIIGILVAGSKRDAKKKCLVLFLPHFLGGLDCSLSGYGNPRNWPCILASIDWSQNGWQYLMTPEVTNHLGEFDKNRLWFKPTKISSFKRLWRQRCFKHESWNFQGRPTLAR